MARLLEHRQAPPRIPDKTGDVKMPIIESEADEALENEGVPFIEIGAPEAKAPAKPLPKPSSRPATIPMIRPEAPTPTNTNTIPPATCYRISFQPLPFRSSSLPLSEARLSPELVTFHQPAHAVSLQYRSVVEEIEKQLPGVHPRSLLFESLRPGTGTTSVLLNVAISCAKMDQQRVVVVDANFSRPAVAIRLGLAPAPGMREVLAKTAPLLWTVQKTAIPSLSAVAVGQRPEHPAIDLWPVLLDQLQQRFDWILIDGGEWNHQPEKPALLATASATYLVLAQPDLESTQANDMLADMTMQGGKVRGYVLVQK
jgi:Mrp family chromosome partitioning ATPase